MFFAGSRWQYRSAENKADFKSSGCCRPGAFIDPKLAAQLKLTPVGNETAKGSGGTTQVQFAKNVNIDAAGVKLPNMTVALLDMTDLSKLVQTDLKIILDREFFGAGRVLIDIAGGKIQKLDRSIPNPPRET